MKTLFFILVTTLAFGQISYQPSNEVIANPDRGMYYHTETTSTNYNALNQTTLINKRVNDKITLILRVFYLEGFKNSPISETYLNNIKADFIKCRNADVKVIVRFSYNSSSSQADAPKEIVLNHINQLAQVINENQDVIHVIQAGFIGSYGEGYYTTNFGNAGNLTAQNITDRNDVLKAELDNFQGIIQVRTPLFKSRFIGDTQPLQVIEDNYKSRIGHHNDSFLSSNSEQGTYSGSSSNIISERNYIKQETNFVPIGGECNEFPTAYTDNVLNDMNEYHYTYLNSVGYASGIIDYWNSLGWLNTIKQKLGYRFVLKSSDIQLNGNTLSASIEMRNEGYATPFKKYRVYLMCNNYRYEIQTDVRNWQTEWNVTKVADISNLPAGNYNVYLRIELDNSSVQTANIGTWENGQNKLNFTFTKSDLSINHYTIDNVVYFGQELRYNVYNAIGQKVYSNASNQLNLSNLQKGIYFIKFDKYKSIKIIK
jgi:hypothetical protein